MGHIREPIDYFRRLGGELASAEQYLNASSAACARLAAEVG
jgi:hypothetical protein